MNDDQSIPRTDFTGTLAHYDGKFGWPTFGDIKPFLPAYYHQGCEWAKWDLCNKSKVLHCWLDKQLDKEWQDREVKHLAETQARYEQEKREREAQQERERIARLAKQGSESERRARADAIHSDQMEASRRKHDLEQRKRDDKSVDDTCEAVSEALRCLNTISKNLHRLPPERRNEVDLDALLVTANKLKQFVA